MEMFKAAGDTGATIISDLATMIIRDGKVPTDWEQSFKLCLYKGKGDALDRGNYQGLKLLVRACQEEALQMQYLWSRSCRRNI